MRAKNYDCGKCKFFKQSDVCAEIARLPCFQKIVGNIKRNLRFIYLRQIAEGKKIREKNVRLLKENKLLKSKLNVNLQKIKKITG